MNKNIFRFWDKRNKKYIYSEKPNNEFGNLLTVGMHGLPVIVDTDSMNTKEIIGWNVDHIYDIEQYTGLDIELVVNKKMVFEGDIVLVTDLYKDDNYRYEDHDKVISNLSARKYEVVWNKTKWGIKLLTDSFSSSIIFDMPTKNVSYEVIGNVHEDVNFHKEIVE